MPHWTDLADYSPAEKERANGDLRLYQSQTPANTLSSHKYCSRYTEVDEGMYMAFDLSNKNCFQKCVSIKESLHLTSSANKVDFVKGIFRSDKYLRHRSSMK
jgi:hypothetical protein